MESAQGMQLPDDPGSGAPGTRRTQMKRNHGRPGVSCKRLLGAATHESNGGQKGEHYHTRDGSAPELASVKFDGDDPVRPLIHEEVLSRLL